MALILSLVHRYGLPNISTALGHDAHLSSNGSPSENRISLSLASSVENDLVFPTATAATEDIDDSIRSDSIVGFPTLKLHVLNALLSGANLSQVISL